MTSYLINPLPIYEHIKTKQKVHFVDFHHYLPWILFSDKDNNVVIYDVSKKHVIRAFSLSQYLPEDIKIKAIRFFDCINKKFVENYEIDPMLKIKGISFNLRSSLIYLVSDKHVFFYSYLLQNFIRFIPSKELNESDIVFAEVFDYTYIIILTADGNINKWHIQDWRLVSVISSKQEFGKAVVAMKVIQLQNESKYVIVGTKNGRIYQIEPTVKGNDIKRIDTNSKAQHDKEISYIDFNPFTNILITISKNNIILYDIFNSNTNFRKIPNFSLSGSEKISGLLPNLSTCFDNNSYFIYGKAPKVYLLDLHLNDQTKIDAKSISKQAQFSLELDKLIFSKVNDEGVRVYKVEFLEHLSEYIIIACNKGVIICKFDPTFTAPVCTLPIMTNSSNKYSSFFFYHLTKENLIRETRLSCNYNKKNKLEAIIKQSSIKEKILDSSKVDLNRFEIKCSYDFSLMSCLDTISNTYIIYKIIIDKSDNSVKDLKMVETGNALCLQWCPYNNNYAITRKQQSANLFTLEVYSVIERQSAKKIFEVNDLFTHKIFTGHFIGVIVRKNGEHLQVSMKYINAYTYDYNKEAELNFYFWEEENKLILTIKEEPIEVISSEDLQYMIICFEDKYNIYKLNELSGNLEKINTVYVKVVSGFIYESLIFVYLTEYGTYFQLLNKENCYPCKLFRQSDGVNMYNLKISKKFKENKIFYERKPKQNKILLVHDNLIFTCDSYGNIEVSENNHILFKFISLIRKKNLNGITALLGFLDKKLIKFALLIFEHYFENNEQILRKIFSEEMIQNFELYNYFEFFINDLAKSNPLKLESVLEKYLIKAIIASDSNKINEIYDMAKKYNLKMTTKAARTINKNVYLDSLMSKKRYVESYLFNQTCKINNQNNDNILSMAIGQLTSK